MPTPGGIRRLYASFQTLIHELAKFGVVGVLTLVIDVTLFNVCLHEGIGPLTSKALSVIAAATTSYFLNRHWTFSHRARLGLAREFWVFFLLSAIGLLITEACLGFSHYLLGLHSRLADNVAANVVGLVLGTMFRFWSFKRYVFLDSADLERVPEAAEAALQ